MSGSNPLITFYHELENDNTLSKAPQPYGAWVAEWYEQVGKGLDGDITLHLMAHLLQFIDRDALENTYQTPKS